MLIVSRPFGFFSSSYASALRSHDGRVRGLPGVRSARDCGARRALQVFVLYCGRDHQSADFPAHKATCKRVKKSRDLMADETDTIRNAIEDDWTPANAFETHAGRFWRIMSTRPYMRAKLELIRALSSIPSRAAIEAALVVARDFYDLIAATYQEAYDIIKWYGTSANDPNYDWANMSLPFLDIHGADMAEEIPEATLKDRDVFLSAALVYIKMHLVNAVQDAIAAHSVGDRTSLPALATDALGAFLAPNGKRRSLSELKTLRKTLERQMQRAMSTSHFHNQHFWTAMLDPAPIVAMPKPQTYAPGDANEVRLWVLPNAMLWRDHHAFTREFRERYPDFLPEMPHRGPKMMHNYH